MQLQSIPPVLPVRVLRAGICFVLFSSLISASAPPLENSKADLRSKDASVRLDATRSMLEKGGDDLSTTLRRLLKDDDWEIAILAAKGLGDFGSDKDMRVLAQVAVTAPIRELRLGAAESMGKVDAPAASRAILVKLAAQPTFTCEALTVIAPHLENPEMPPELSALLQSESPRIREAATSAMLTLERENPGEIFRTIMESGHLGVRARGLELAQRYPHGSMIAALRQLLSQANINDVVLRRAFPAMIAALGALDSGASSIFQETIQILAQDELPEVACRATPLAVLAIGEDWAKDLDLLNMTITLRRHKDPGVRTSAVQLIRHLKGAATKKTAFAMFNRERDDRVRLELLKSILALQPVGSNEGMHWAIKQLGRSPSPEIAQELVVSLGHRKFVEETAVASALVDALENPDWAVAACAAVSIGRTRNRWGAKSLMTMARDNKDWRLRGAAVVGLIHTARERCMPALIAALGDKDPTVAHTAMTYMSSLRVGDSFGTDPRDWTTWWEKEKDHIELYKIGGVSERQERYGPDASNFVIYKGVDVMVMDSAEGSMLEVFERTETKHRSIPRTGLETAPLNARGVLVVNQAGPWDEMDMERVRWYVKVGGLLLSSGGSTGESIQQIEPGVLGIVATDEEPKGNVIASVDLVESSFTRGVFDPDVVPFCQLDGSHLIDVRKPERVHVLFDSPDSAERWGGGNLSCWMRSGHGTLLDVASPKSRPVFPKHLRLKKPRQRMAYAINHMGASYELIRETASEKSWKSDSKAEQYIPDDSVFRLLTNFVRERRFEGN